MVIFAIQSLHGSATCFHAHGWQHCAIHTPGRTAHTKTEPWPNSVLVRCGTSTTVHFEHNTTNNLCTHNYIYAHAFVDRALIFDFWFLTLCVIFDDVELNLVHLCSFVNSCTSGANSDLPSL